MKSRTYNFTNQLILLLTITLSTNIFCMRMTEAGKQRATKYLQQTKAQQMHEREEKLKTAIIPYWSYKQATQINPVIFYEPDQKRMLLNFVENNRLKNTSISPTQVSFYNFSPQKKYLIFQMSTTTSAKKSIGYKESLITWALSKVLKRPVGEEVETITTVTKIVDLQNFTEIASFDGDLITYQLSPDETTLIIARRHLGKKLSDEGASSLKRPQNDTTRYELFDIASQSTLKTFENVQMIDYSSEDNLVVQYDNETIKQIAVQRNASSMMNIFRSQSIPNIIETTENVSGISKKITYYDSTKELSITLAHGKKITEANVIAYTLSPLKNYLIIFKEKSAMYLINTKTGKKLDNIATNVITYTFSPDEKETRLIELGAPREFFTGENILYSLVDVEKPSYSLTTFTVDNGFYFKSPNELVVVDKNGTFTSYNPQTGISYEKEQQQKRKQIIQEIRTKERSKEEEQKKLEQEQSQQAEKEAKEYFEQTQKRQKEYREQGEKRQEEMIQQQQEIQKAYEKSVEIIPEEEKEESLIKSANRIGAEYIEQGTEYIESLRPSTEEAIISDKDKNTPKDIMTAASELIKSANEVGKEYIKRGQDYIKSFWATPQEPTSTQTSTLPSEYMYHITKKPVRKNLTNPKGKPQLKKPKAPQKK